MVNKKYKPGAKPIRQILLRLWPLYALAMAVSVGLALVSWLYGDHSPKYELARHGGEVDFTAPELVAHTATAGSITHSTISIRPYDVTVPGVGCAYGSVIWKMNINGEAAFCLEIWKLAGGTYTAGDASSGNGDTAQYLANFMASGKSNAEYVATQVLVWESRSEGAGSVGPSRAA